MSDPRFRPLGHDREELSERKNLDSFDVPAPAPVAEPQAMLGVPAEGSDPSTATGSAPADFDD